MLINVIRVYNIQTEKYLHLWRQLEQKAKNKNNVSKEKH